MLKKRALITGITGQDGSYLRAVRRQRHLVQPRVSASWRDLRDPQGHPRRRADPGGPGRLRLHGQPRPIRDWGYAPEYVEGMWRMLQADQPDDYALATGGNFTVRDFVVTAFEHAGLDWEKHVRFDERYLRPTEVDALVGDASKAERLLGWKAKVQTDQLARIMVDADIEALKHEGKPWIDQPVLADWPRVGRS